MFRTIWEAVMAKREKTETGWDEVEVPQVKLKTLADHADEQALALKGQYDLKAETSKCSKAIHAMGGAEWVWDQLGSGVLVTAICDMLGVSTHSLHRWVERGGEARAALYARAREAGAHTLAEQTISIADMATKEDVQVAKLRSDNRWRMASKLNADAYGDKQAQINVNIGDLALDALRKRSVIDVEDVKPVHRLDD